VASYRLIMGISKDKIFIAISNRNKIEVVYIDAEGISTTRIIRPYHIFTWNRKIYFMGFCEYDNDIRTFRISRIRHFGILKETFDDKVLNFVKYDAQGYFKFFGNRYPVKKLNLKNSSVLDRKGQVKCPLPDPKRIMQTDRDIEL